ncbi:hypothetical protein J2S09_002899 [Bacillus fengqiuensis]|nr:hypothetical protein [Bacillus fengqiuensis]
MAYMKQLAALMVVMGLLAGCGTETNVAEEQERPAAQEPAVEEANETRVFIRVSFVECNLFQYIEAKGPMLYFVPFI